MKKMAFKVISGLGVIANLRESASLTHLKTSATKSGDPKLRNSKSSSFYIVISVQSGIQVTPDAKIKYSFVAFLI